MLANCLVNADYHGSGGIIVSKGYQKITLSNPGSFRVPLDTAKSGGVSDPRNAAMARMFRFVDVGEYTGGGIPNLQDAEDFLKLGADRLGTSRIVKAAKAMEKGE